MAAAVRAEELGYASVWVPDADGKGLFDRLSALLSATGRITVATGVLNLWMNDPKTVAQRYAELTAAHEGRLLLGIGVSHAPVVEGSGAGVYTRPIARTAEFLDALDAASPPVPAGKRLLAALGPRMLDLARERTAGAHSYLVTPGHTRAARAALGADRLLVPEVTVVAESDPGRAREIARAGLAVYLTLPNYVNNWLRSGFTEDDVARGGSDRLVDELVAWGGDETIAARLQAFRDAGADHLAVQMWDRDTLAASRRGETQTGFPLADWERLAPLLNG
ncbi:LLM class F420-dependent oxidoreductase [Streptomyces inusitatus]|uniref:LLM class F420-dependent oxidoreductase n=1 Tax=Streptomyces inusitatus TaxID=68221 RepID=A0A918QBT8_9ACTN|nr:LLM class F420-dependent oxidoreductase [Streptomyces inusitatus]